MLKEKNYLVEVLLVRISDKLSDDARTNLERLRGGTRTLMISELEEVSSLVAEDPGDHPGGCAFWIRTDPQGEWIGQGCDFGMSMNWPNLRIAIDIPSGLFGEDKRDNDRDAIFQVGFTLALQAPSLSFFFSGKPGICWQLGGVAHRASSADPGGGRIQPGII